MSSHIQPGSRLGRYEIRSHIGAGGMGDVYLARDTELGRSVALKVLPPSVAADQQRMRRFVQEFSERGQHSKTNNQLHIKSNL